MKSLLVVALVFMIAFLAYRNHAQQQAIESFQESERRAETARQIEEANQRARGEAAQRLEAEREQRKLQIERDNAIAERDDARQQAQAAQNEIARLTNTTPRPLTWFERRQTEAGKLDAPAANTNSRVRTPFPYYYSR